MSHQPESRPGPSGESRGTFPREWGPPLGPDATTQEIRVWIKLNVLKGMERRQRGETVPWLAERR